MHYRDPGWVSSCTVDARRYLPRIDSRACQHFGEAESDSYFIPPVSLLFPVRILLSCVPRLRCIRIAGMLEQHSSGGSWRTGRASDHLIIDNIELSITVSTPGESRVLITA